MRQRNSKDLYAPVTNTITGRGRPIHRSERSRVTRSKLFTFELRGSEENVENVFAFCEAQFERFVGHRKHND
jgi:hypothetical protein